MRIFGYKKKTSFNKYSAVKQTDSSGRKNDSGLECEVSEMFLLKEKAGKIKILARGQQVRFEFNGHKFRGWYQPDFTIFDFDLNKIIWAEVKGFETESWKWKYDLWASGGPGDLYIYRGSKKNFTCTEILKPVIQYSTVDMQQVLGKIEIPKIEK